MHFEVLKKCKNLFLLSWTAALVVRVRENVRGELQEAGLSNARRSAASSLRWLLNTPSSPANISRQVCHLHRISKAEILVLLLLLLPAAMLPALLLLLHACCHSAPVSQNGLADCRGCQGCVGCA